ncbi:chemotaxis protein CheC [Desulfitispora alkaliphila]|uniref:chemotaxis protein CheC n=1 Tax=Desulfitispora alkaliphila TaxID=622674 RepID=UPI003D25AF4A
MLNQLQKDALTEFMNIYIGQAASLLSEIVDERIQLKIPEIHLVSMSSNIETKFDASSLFPKGHVLSSSISFGSDFTGKARLVFPAEKTGQLVNLCLGEDTYEEEVTPNKLSDTDSDAVREIGNIVLNAVVGGLGNLMEIKLNYSLPDIELLFFPNVEENIAIEEDFYVLVIKNTFSFASSEIEGAILVVLSIESVSYLIKKIDEVLLDVYN